MMQIRERPAAHIEEVIEQLDTIIQLTRSMPSRVGFFPALYNKVTIRVAEGIQRGEFEDNARMELLDVVFANRYIDAWERYYCHESRDNITNVWMDSFNMAGSTRLIIIQHLLLGMNAHINLDLGAAAATVAPGVDLLSLENDFMAINRLLADLVDVVQDELALLSPWMRRLDRLGGRMDEAIFNFSMRKARDSAWTFARYLAALPAPEREQAIARRDHEFTRFARLIIYPGRLVDMGRFLIRLRESTDLPHCIDTLSYRPEHS